MPHQISNRLFSIVDVLFPEDLSRLGGPFVPGRAETRRCGGTIRRASTFSRARGVWSVQLSDSNFEYDDATKHAPHLPARRS